MLKWITQLNNKIIEVHEDRIVKIFSDLVTISSPSYKEHGVIDYIINFVKPYKVRVKKYPFQGSFNLLLLIDGKEKKQPILFSGHTDTVGPCEKVTPVITKDRISSDGTTILGSDDKAALAIFLEGIRILKENNIDHGPLEILLSCAEEVGLQGAKHFDYKELKSKYGFVFDSDGPVGKIILKAPYHSTMKVTVTGKAAHAGMEPEKGINAINVIAEIVQMLPTGRLDEESTANIGVISGGKATNIVAEEAYIALEIRSMSKTTLQKYEKQTKEIIQTIAKKYKSKQKIQYNLEYSGFTIDESDYIVDLVKQAMKKNRIKAVTAHSGGGSDTNIFHKAGIRAINLSCGMRNAHTKKEYIAIKDLINGTKLMLSIIQLFDK